MIKMTGETGNKTKPVYENLTSTFKEKMRRGFRIDDDTIINHFHKCCVNTEALQSQDSTLSNQECYSLLLSTLEMQERILRIVSNSKPNPIRRNSVQQPIIIQTVSKASVKSPNEDSTKSRIHGAILSTILKKKNTKEAISRKEPFAEVVGLEEIKQIVFEAIILPNKCPQLFADPSYNWSRILLFGPPGTGKTLLAKSIFHQLDCITFYSVSSSDVISSWVGESAKFIKELFTHANNQKEKSVIFIDEIDSLCRKRSSNEADYTRCVKTEFLRQLDGVHDSSSNVFLLCATNCPWELDSALIRRFQRCFYIPLPNRNARLEILSSRKNSFPGMNLSAEDLRYLVEKTEGFSGSDMDTLIKSAYFQNLRSMQDSNYWKMIKDGYWTPCLEEDTAAMRFSFDSLPKSKITPTQLNLKDFISALSRIHPTVKKDDLQNYQDFTEEFGSFG